MSSESSPSPQENLPVSSSHSHEDHLARLFFAVLPGEQEARFLKSRTEHGRRQRWGDQIRWTDAESHHLTLLFLKNFPESKIPTLLEAIDQIFHQAPKSTFEVKIEEMRLFPRVSRPRALACNIQPTPQLKELIQVLRNAAKNTGAELDEKPLRPHITLGRLKPGFNRNTSFRLSAKPIPFTVSNLTLFQSTLLPEEAVNTPLKSWTFASPASAD